MPRKMRPIVVVGDKTEIGAIMARKFDEPIAPPDIGVYGPVDWKTRNAHRRRLIGITIKRLDRVKDALDFVAGWDEVPNVDMTAHQAVVLERRLTRILDPTRRNPPTPGLMRDYKNKLIGFRTDYPTSKMHRARTLRLPVVG